MQTVIDKRLQQAPVCVKFKRLHPDAVIPKQATPGSAGFDLCCLAPVRHWEDELSTYIDLVSTGLAVEIPPGYEMQIRPRSGLAREYGAYIANAPGTIDSDYRGEIKIMVVRACCLYVPRGTRIAQAVIAPVPPVNIVEVNELGDTQRGTGGFGSTGLKGEACG